MSRRIRATNQVQVTMYIDELSAEQMWLDKHSHGQMSDNVPAVMQATLAIRQAERNVAFVIAKRQAGLLDQFLLNLLRWDERLLIAMRRLRLRRETYHNSQEYIIQLQWYASEHPFHGQPNLP